MKSVLKRMSILSRRLKFLRSFSAVSNSVHLSEELRLILDRIEQVSGSSDLKSTFVSTKFMPLNNSCALIRMRWGAYLAVDPNNLDQLIGLLVNQQWEPATTKLIMERCERGSINVNVGTSYGYYAALLGVWAGSTSKTYCFEANSYMIPYLLKTAYWTGVINDLKIMNCAISDSSNEIVKLRYMPQFAGGGGVNEATDFIKVDRYEDTLWSLANLKLLEDESGFLSPGKAIYLESEVKTKTLDELIPEGDINILKIDIEGMESEAILGGRNLIKRSKNISIILEMSEYSYQNAGELKKLKYLKAWDFLLQEGFKCKGIIPMENYESEVRMYPVNDFSEWVQVRHGDFLFSRS